MKISGPRPTGERWTPADDAQLLALLALKMDKALIARKLKTHNQRRRIEKAYPDPEGESEPAVPTPDGVKEPLNRRATVGINF